MRLSEFRVLANDPNLGDPSSERILLEINQTFANHNGGEVGATLCDVIHTKWRVTLFSAFSFCIYICIY